MKIKAISADWVGLRSGHGHRCEEAPPDPSPVIREVIDAQYVDPDDLQETSLVFRYASWGRLSLERRHLRR